MHQVLEVLRDAIGAINDIMNLNSSAILVTYEKYRCISSKFRSTIQVLLPSSDQLEDTILLYYHLSHITAKFHDDITHKWVKFSFSDSITIYKNVLKKYILVLLS